LLISDASKVLSAIMGKISRELNVVSPVHALIWIMNVTLDTLVSLNLLANAHLKLKNLFGISLQLSVDLNNVMCMGTMKFHKATARSQVIFALMDFSKHQLYILAMMDLYHRF
jgi:hypothetical protein